MAELERHSINTPYMVGPVHCYSGRLAGELVLFDTGPPTPWAQQYLRDHIDLENLRHVFITHCHVDHCGQARWLAENSDAAIYLPERDYRRIIHHDRRIKVLRRMLAERGFDDEYLEKLQQILDRNILFPPFPENCKLAERDLPERLAIRVLHCPGHSQSDLVYVGNEWAVTGDTLLKGVFQSPLLDVDPEHGTRFKNYEAYCATLVKLAGLQDKTILSAHRQPVSDLKGVLIFYISKLFHRVRQLLPFEDEENLPVLIDKLLWGKSHDTMQVYFKASEIIFMRDFLRQPGLLRQALEHTGLFDSVADKFHAAVHSSCR